MRMFVIGSGYGSVGRAVVLRISGIGTLEVRSSTPVIGKIYIEHLFTCLLSSVLNKTKINKKRPGMFEHMPESLYEGHQNYQNYFIFFCRKIAGGQNFAQKFVD